MTNEMIVSRTTAQAPSSPVLGPHFMLRIAPIAFERLGSLRFVDTVEWMGEILRIERLLDSAAQSIPDQIAALIKGEEDEAHRRTLINLRRDIFNSREPRNAETVTQALCRLPNVLSLEIAEWLATMALYRRCRCEGKKIFDAELPRRRQELQRILSSPSLRSGILLSSPSLDDVIPRYLAMDPGSIPRRMLRVERSAAEYLHRTIAKTSPFSTLTAVGLGVFSDETIKILQVDSKSVDTPKFRSRARLNVAVLSRVGEAIIARDEMLDDLSVALSTGWTSDQRRIRYMRRTRRLGEASAAMTLDRFEENLFFLAHSDIVDDLFTLLPEGSTMPFHDIREILHAKAPSERPMEEIWRYLRHLLRLNLITVPSLTVNIHAPNPVVDFAERMGAIGTSWAMLLKQDLHALQVMIESYSTASVDERRQIIQDLHAASKVLFLNLKVENPAGLRTVLYEDSSMEEGSIVGSRDLWTREIASDLNVVAKILPVFDALLPHRHMVRGFFEARHGKVGRCDDIMKFTHDFHQDVYDQYLRYSTGRKQFIDGEYQGQENWFKLDEVAALDDARRELITAMTERFAAHAGGDEIVLDEHFFERVAAKLPPQDQALESRAYFAQVGKIDGRDRLVINKTYSGLSLLFSRFHHCFPGGDGGKSLAERLQTYLKEVTPTDAVFAEITGGFDTTNLNLHEIVTPYEIVCPGEVSFRPPEEQISVRDLSIVRHPASEALMLWSAQLECEVIPVYLGFLMPMTLPEMQRLLLSFSCNRVASIDLWSGTDKPLGESEVGGHPRVRYGDIVLVRRVWKTAPGNLPEGLLGSKGADCILGWGRWRLRHKLPRFVFASPDVTFDEDQGSTDAAMRFGKPLFVDFENYFSLRLLDMLAQRANRRIVFTEMLPAPDELVVCDADREHRVTELTFEIVQKGGRL